MMVDSSARRIAVVNDFFVGPDAEECLGAKLDDAKRRGACLVVLPELPFNRWMAISRERVESDAESKGGRRVSMLSRAASKAGVAVLGGAIVHSETSESRRYNTGILVDSNGKVISSYRKVHLPEEPGYWETSHYEPGTSPPPCENVPDLGMNVGIQICSDVMRPAGWQILAANGAEVILAPRATPPSSYERWKMVLRTMAVTCAAYVVSTNRPVEDGCPNGGASLVIHPSSEVILETAVQGAVEVAEVSHAEVRQAKTSYPGYLAYPCSVYKEGWRERDDQA